MIRRIVREYTYGVTSSLQGFLTLHKLDAVSTDGFIGVSHSNSTISAASSQQTRASSAEPTSSRPTVLERRRQQANKSNNRASQPSISARKRTKASTRVIQVCVFLFFSAFIRAASVFILQLVVVNVAIILALQILYAVTELLVPAKTSTIYSMLGYFRDILILPIFVVIRLVSAFWFSDIANAAYRFRNLKAPKNDAANVNISIVAADLIHSVLAELLVLLQAQLFSTLPVPIVADAAAFVYMSLLHSLYSFEYGWILRNISMKQRHERVERHWPYHLGFGTALTLATSLTSNFVVNSCIFGTLFPFFIVSSTLSDVSADSAPSGIPIVNFFYIAERLTAKISSVFCNIILKRN